MNPENKKTRLFLIATLVISGISALLPISTEAKTIFNVPFTVQAPDGIWKQPWQDACEEAVTVMADYYYTGKKYTRIPTAQARAAIMKTVNLENKFFGFNKDTNAEQMIEIINNFYPWEAFIVDDPTLEQIKAEIDNERPVILPVYGKGLKNPYFRSGGPVYHTILVKGYDDDRNEFITNEPGVGRGLDYRYKYATLMSAIHDFLPNNKTIKGRKVAIFTSPDIYSSKSLDGDKDGLTKLEEQKYHTGLTVADTDGDGFSDGDEVKSGYLPTVAETKIPSGALLKSVDNPKVYLLSQIYDSVLKQEIASEEVFLNFGWKWRDIVVVSAKFLSELKDGAMIR
ncbi:MAG: C39 family peptidase [Patescibacteria group bacterium]